MAECNTCGGYLSMEDKIRLSMKCDANGNVVWQGALLNSNFTNTGKISVMRVGDILYTAVKYDADYDLLIQYKKCMANNLMTFYKVGLVANTLDAPILNPAIEPHIEINVATGDNIGPLNINNNWAGGNHTYGDDDIPTAETLSFTFYANGVVISDGDNYLTDTIKVVSNNIIKDISKPTMEGETIVSLDEILCTEQVTYEQRGGTIKVNLRHTFQNTDALSITTYYGAQSMADANQMFFPEGHTADFVTKENVTGLKSDYPNFKKFIQKNTIKGWYESVYLTYNGIGDHHQIDADDSIYLQSGSKMYHKMIAGQSVSIGTVNNWEAWYNWNKPDNDDTNFFVQKAEIGGKIYVFIDIKQAVDTDLSLPLFVGKSFTTEYASTGITLASEVDADGLHIISTGTGSIILQFEMVEVPVIGHYFKLTSKGDGTGVATLRLSVSDTTVITLSGSGKFYDDSGGTTNESNTRTITAGGLRTLYLKIASGISEMTFDNAYNLTGIGSENTVGWESSTNASDIELKVTDLNLLCINCIQDSMTIKGALCEGIEIARLTVNYNHTSELPLSLKTISFSGAGLSFLMSRWPTALEYCYVRGGNITLNISEAFPETITYIRVDSSNYNWTGLSIPGASNITTLNLTNFRTSKLTSAQLIDLLTSLTNRSGNLPATITINDYADYASPPQAVTDAVAALKIAKSITTVNLGA